MSSAVHSPSSTSLDVVLLPHPLNHVNHNHTESSSSSSTTKSLKRNRSPSLTRDNQTNDLSIPLDTPTKRSRRKRNTTDIDQSLGRHLSADKLFIYQWPLDELHADFYVLQEQICDYLSLKSFKRKYPDIYRRIVDLHEREYLKSENVVTETQCDLGLTALKLDEVLELMSNDYPEKHHQFNHIWQQKRRTFLSSSSVSNPPILLSASISNQLSMNQSFNSLDNGDKNRSSKLLSNTMRKDLIHSTMEYNIQLQRERRQDRKACFDLQTMQIHFPSNRQFRLPPHLTKIGSYPLALVPGQYQDSYIKYSSEELKYMPISTALYYYPKSAALVHSERFSQQGASSDEEVEEEGCTSTIRPTISNPLTPQSPLIVNGISSNSNGSSSVRPVKSSNSQLNICHMCKIEGEDENEDELMTCTSCNHKYHPVCLDVNNEMLNIIKTYSWQCIDCKSCAKCNKTHDEANMMFCDRCDRGYHSYCVGLEAIPDGSWQCSACDPTPAIKGKRGRPSNRSSPRQQQTTNSPKAELVPTRVSSRRSRPILSTPLSPSNNTNHSSNSSSTDVQSNTNSPSVNLVLTRHQQQWTTTPKWQSSSTQQIRPIIECFCQILSSHGFSSITPEIFRLAKFDRDEATIPLWRLLFEILYFDPMKNNQQQIIEKFDRTPKDELVYLIKNDLFTRGYTYEYFLSLDNKMQKGSRQLLICLGWLIYHIKLIENYLKQCLNSDSIFDHDDTSSLYHVNDIKDHVKFIPQEKNLIGQIKQAMRVNSKLRFSLRRLHGLVIENANLQHQIHECHNMSSFEAHLCQHPHLLSHYMIELENEHRKLNFFLFWNENEDVFWKWMESVLDQTTIIEQEDDDKYEALNKVDCQRLEAEKQKFNAAIDTLDSALIRLEQLWISNNNHASIEQDVSSIVASIDIQVSSLFNQLLATNPSSLISKHSSDQSLFLHQPHRLVYAQKNDSNENNRFIKPTDFDHETNCLNALQTNIDQHIEKQRIILDTLSHQFENVMIV